MEVFTSKADEVKKILKETPPDQLQDSVLTFLSYMSAFLTAFVEHNGAEGWSAFVMNERGSILDSQAQKKMEKTLASCPWLLPYLKGDTSYKGGGQEGEAGEKEMEENLRYLMQMINDGKAQIKELGLVKLIHSDIPIPPNPITPLGINIPLAPFFMGLMALIDLFRYNRARLGNKNMLLTLLVFIEEILTEQWHQALFTSLGFFSATGVSMGIVAKYILNVFLLAQPAQERGKFVQASVTMGKSFITGTLAWVLETFTSQSIKDKLIMYADADAENGFSFIDIHNKLKDKASEIMNNPAKMCVMYAPVISALNGTKMQPIFLAMLSLFGFPPANKVISVCSGSVAPLLVTETQPVQEAPMKGPEPAALDASPLASTVASPLASKLASPSSPSPPPLKKGGYKKTRSKKRKVSRRLTRSQRPLIRAAT